MKKLMMVGIKKVKNEVKAYRMVDVEKNTVKDYTKVSLLKKLAENKLEIINMKLENQETLNVLGKGESAYGVVGETNAFVVLSKVMNNAIVTYYEIADTCGNVFKVRPYELSNLLGVYKMANGIIEADKENICPSPFNTNYFVKQLGDSVAIRREKAMALTKELQKANVLATGLVAISKNQSPTQFLVTANGLTGWMNTHPGTGYYNRLLPQKFKLNNLEYNGNCQSVNPSNGCRESYDGLKVTSHVETIFQLSDRKVDFEIDYVSSYDTLGEGEFYTDYAYYVHFNALKVRVYVKKDGTIGKTSVYKID